MKMTTARETSVDLPGGVALRLALTSEPDGQPGLLVLSLGHGEPAWLGRTDSIVVPGKALGDLITALESLRGES